MKLSLDEMQLLQILFTEADHQGMLKDQDGMVRLRERINHEANRLSNPDAWERDERAIRASEQAKHWHVVGCAVGRALAAVLNDRHGVGEDQHFSITSKELREWIRKVNIHHPHPSAITGLLMRQMHLAEPMLKQLTKADRCTFIYDRDSKVLSVEVFYE